MKQNAMPTQRMMTTSTTPGNWHPPQWDLLLTAAQQNRPVDIWKLVKRSGVSPNHCNSAGQTALHIAALWGHVDCVALLVSKDIGANPNAQNFLTGATPLHMAAQSKKIKESTRLNLVIDVLLEAGADKGLADNFGQLPVDLITKTTPGREQIRSKLHVVVPPPPMFEAILQGDFARILALFYAAKQSPHELACHIYKDRTTVQAIVDVMVTCIVDAFAPMEVWMEADLHALQILLACGAPPTVAMLGGRTRRSSILELDMDDEGMVERDVWNIPDTAPLVRLLDSVQHVLCSDNSQLRPYIERNNNNGRMSSLDLPPIVRLWLEGCQSLQDRHQRNLESLSQILYIKPSPLLSTNEVSRYWHNAARRGHLLFLRALYHYLPDIFHVNATNRQGMTALHFAARSGQTEVLRFLLALPQVDVRKRDAIGKTALDAAMVNGHTAAVELLQVEQ
jgi:ankyrin repeat protein